MRATYPDIDTEDLERFGLDTMAELDYNGLADLLGFGEFEWVGWTPDQGELDAMHRGFHDQLKRQRDLEVA